MALQTTSVPLRFPQVDPYPGAAEVCGAADIRRPDTCPSR